MSTLGAEKIGDTIYDILIGMCDRLDRLEAMAARPMATAACGAGHGAAIATAVNVDPSAAYARPLVTGPTDAQLEALAVVMHAEMFSQMQNHAESNFRAATGDYRNRMRRAARAAYAHIAKKRGE